MTELSVREHPDAEAMAAALADELAQAIRVGTEERGRATLALAGGSTPTLAYRRLDEQSLDWRAVTLVATDERWVPAEHELSNAGMFRRELRRAVAAGCQIVEMSTAPQPIERGLATVEKRLESVTLPFDVVLLGMGSDGHTASLFPDDPGLDALMTRASAAGIARPASQPTARISLTPDWLASARCLTLAISGAEKRRVLEHALKSRDPMLPIRRVLERCRSPILLHWCP